MGPALDGVSARLADGPLREALMDPSRSIVSGYGVKVLETRDGEIIKGRLSKPAQRLVKQWTEINQTALMTNWAASRPGSRRAMERIPGLDTPQ